MKVTLANIDSFDFKAFKKDKERIEAYLLFPHSTVLVEDKIALIGARNQNGKIFFDMVETVDVKKHLKRVYSLIKEMLKVYNTDTYYMEVSKKNLHIKDNFYKNCEKVFENNQKIIYKRRVK